MTHDTNRSSSPESSPELIPDIVLLGEATATLDPDAAQEVDAALGRALAGRTLVVIAHRQATELACDLVAGLSPAVWCRTVRLGCQVRGAAGRDGRRSSSSRRAATEPAAM